MLKAPLAVQQFFQKMTREEEKKIFIALENLSKETKTMKKERILNKTEKKEEIVTGLSEITKCVERKNLKFVLIAADTNPLEQVIWLPNLCKKMNVPFGIIKSRARLGKLARYKKCAVIGVRSNTQSNKKVLDEISKELYDKYNLKKN